MRQNIGLKIFALALALIVWIQITLMAEHRSIVNIKVSVENIPEGVVIDDIPERLPFIVRGKGLDILRLRISNVQVNLDASTLKPGADLLSLQDYTVTGLPDDIDVQLSGISEEQQIAVSTDVLHQKTLPVQIRFADDEARRIFEREAFAYTPEKIVVSGARTRLQPLRLIETTPISSDMLREQSFNADIIMPYSNIRGNVSQVNISRVRSISKTRIIENIPVRGEANAQYLPAKITIKLVGTPQIVDRIKTTDIVIIPAAQPDSDGWFDLQVQLPDGVDDHAITPTRVRLRK